MDGHGRRPFWSWEPVKRLVVCTLLLWQISQISGDECGTRFTDPASSTVLAEVVIQGMIDDAHAPQSHIGNSRMNVTVEHVYKGMDVLKEAGHDQKVMVGYFGEEDKERCVASMEDMGDNSMHILFLRRTSNRDMLQLSALPLRIEGNVERRVRRSLCDTCVRPPQIRKITCRDCARKPEIKDMRSRKVKMGKRGRLRCAATGHPTPTFSWSKNGIPITSGSGGVTITNTDTVSILLFQRATSAHKGQYTCVATNEVGNDEKVVTLDVTRVKSAPKYSVENAPDRVICQSNPCLNGGTCYYSASLDLRDCLCTEGYEGVKCENIVTSSRSTRLRNRNHQRQSNRRTGGNNGNAKPDMSPARGENENSQQHSASSQHPKSPSQSLPTQNTVEEKIHIYNSTSISSTTASHPAKPMEQGVDTQNTVSPETISGRLHHQIPGNNNTSTTKSPPQETMKASMSTNAKPEDISSSVSPSPQTKPSFTKDKNKLKDDRRDFGSINAFSKGKKSYLKIVYCKEKDYCFNGGRCKLVRKLNVKFCACSSGFAGMRCEIEV